MLPNSNSSSEIGNNTNTPNTGYHTNPRNARANKESTKTNATGLSLDLAKANKIKNTKIKIQITHVNTGKGIMLK